VVACFVLQQQKHDDSGRLRQNSPYDTGLQVGIAAAQVATAIPTVANVKCLLGGLRLSKG